MKAASNYLILLFLFLQWLNPMLMDFYLINYDVTFYPFQTNLIGLGAIPFIVSLDFSFLNDYVLVL